MVFARPDLRYGLPGEQAWIEGDQRPVIWISMGTLAKLNSKQVRTVVVLVHGDGRHCPLLESEILFQCRRLRF